MRPFDPSNAVAFLGAASRFEQSGLIASYHMGRRIAQRARVLVTGATTGLPFAAAVGAKDAGGTVVGISPAASAEEHAGAFQRPLSFLDFVVFSGWGTEGRGALMLRSVGAAVVVGGESGTLAEFTQAWLLGIPSVGILSVESGLTLDALNLFQSVRNFGTEVLVHDDPLELVDRVIDLHASRGTIGVPDAAGEPMRDDSVADILAALAPLRGSVGA